MIRLTNISLPVGADVFEKIKHDIPSAKNMQIVKKSIDARKKNDIRYVYSVDLCADDEKKLLRKHKNAQVPVYKPYKFPNAPKSDKPVVIVGSGPCGLMCAYVLSENGHKVILIERGKCVEERKQDIDTFFKTGKLDVNSNVQFGEGGAGTFSDGKLTTGIKDERIKKVLSVFYENGAPEEIMYIAKPHIGTDNLFHMVASMRNKIIENGGEIRFSSCLTDIITANNCVKGCVINNDYEIVCDKIVLATGHSARDTFEMLKNKGVEMQQKTFSIGGRIEHPQSLIGKAQYGEAYKMLPSADYKLAVHLPSGRGVYTFCMCPGGYVMAASSEEGGVVTNGMSYFARDGENANSALLVNVTPDDAKSDDPLALMYMQREIEQNAYKVAGSTYKAPAQRVGDFLGTQKSEADVEPTYPVGVVWTQIDKVLPKFVSDAIKEGIVALDKKLKGFADGNAIITVPETRSSSPVRILRDETMQSNIRGLYPCGEGAGYAGGITSAAVDGIKAAEMVVKTQ